MSFCDKALTADIKRDCSNPPVKGFERIGYLIRRADIDWESSTADEDSLVSALVLNSGAKAVKIFQENSAFTGTNSSVTVGTYSNSVTNNVVFVVPNRTPEVVTGVIDPLISGEEFVVVLETKGTKAFQVFGWYQGLVVSAGENDYYSDDTLGGWLITLTETGSPTAGVFFDAGTYATSKDALESLTTAQ